MLNVSRALGSQTGSRFPGNIVPFKRQVKSTVFINNSEQGLSPICHSKIPGPTTTHARCNQRTTVILLRSSSIYPLMVALSFFHFVVCTNTVVRAVRVRCTTSPFMCSSSFPLLIVHVAYEISQLRWSARALPFVLYSPHLGVLLPTVIWFQAVEVYHQQLSSPHGTCAIELESCCDRSVTVLVQSCYSTFS
ncbi:hypothetical protein T05_5845 [Trichinella murrelli]|uniref:Uncharacterized protein n=1 Tax=Trichinella murrelli TaxID=144512 RepID=A0A0V0U408_9BILA|nr:hypothetical protein T05_5845 [Trichinella murrelli]